MYPNGSGSNIGTLLRLIQEDQNKNAASLVPSADPNSPLRGAIQQPLQAPESPGSSRVVSVRPEAVTQQGPQASPTVVAPQAPVAPSAPIAPAPQAPRPAGSSVSAPSTPNISLPTLGTRITPTAVAAPTQVIKGVSTSRPVSNARPQNPSSTPQRSSIGAPVIGGTVGTRLLPALPDILTRALGRFAVQFSDLSGQVGKNLNRLTQPKGMRI